MKLLMNVTGKLKYRQNSPTNYKLYSMNVTNRKLNKSISFEKSHFTMGLPPLASLFLLIDVNKVTTTESD